MELRPYQQEAIDIILADLETQQFELLQAPTGAGKTIMFSKLVERLLKAFEMRVLILAHREILISQTVKRMREVWPEVPVSMACASAGEVDFSQPVVVGSIQTVAKRINELPMFHLVIIDEAHRLQPRGNIGSEGEIVTQDSSYNLVLERLLSYLHTMRVLGVTATPFRLGHGYIYGNKCKPGRLNWFPGLTYQITMKTLIDTGALVPFGGVVADDLTKDLGFVRRNTGGDFNERQLSEVMSRTIHLDAAVEAYEAYGEGRKHGVAFCVDIDHAEALEERFSAAGIPCAAVHSEMLHDRRRWILSEFEAGRINMLLNVGILIEGWDSPQVDLIMPCRPTLAPALFIQMLGRGLRTHPGKTDCKLIDLAGNYDRHGHPDSPTVKIPKNRDNDDGFDEYDDVPLPSERMCEECETVVTTRAWVCPKCGHLLIPQSDIPTLRQLKHDGTVSITDEMAEIIECKIREYRSKAGNDMIQCCITVAPDKRKCLEDILIYPDFSGKGALRWRSWWQTTIRTIPPRSNQEALEREWSLPKFATIRKDGSYWRIGTWIHA